MHSSNHSTKSFRIPSLLALLISIGLWVMDAFSAGFFDYYRGSLYGAISNGINHRIMFLVWSNNIHMLLGFSGFYWYPTYHFEISLPIFPVILTIFLSYAIFLTLMDVFKQMALSSKRKHVMKLSFSVFASTITTGACCTFPIIYFAIAIFVSASASLAFDIYLEEVSYLIDVINGAILIWLHFRNMSVRNNLSSQSL